MIENKIGLNETQATNLEVSHKTLTKEQSVISIKYNHHSMKRKRNANNISSLFDNWQSQQRQTRPRQIDNCKANIS